MRTASTLLSFVLSMLMLSSGAATHGAETDTLVLANGDRLSGRVVKEEGGIIHFRSEVLGLIQIAAAKGKIERGQRVDMDLQLADTSATGAVNPEHAQSAEAKTPAASPAATAVATTTATTNEAAKKSKEKSPWVRRVEFGLTSQSGRRDRFDVSTRASVEYRSEKAEYRLQGRYLYGEVDDRPSTDTLSGSMRGRLDVTPRTFAQAETRFESDDIKRIDTDFTQSLGFGRNLVETEDLRIVLGAGGAARYRDPVIKGHDWNYLVDAFQDLSYSLNSRLKVTQDLSVQLAPFNESDYLVKLNAALSSKISNTLNMSMRYEFEYDSTLADDARYSQRIVTSVGYAF